MSMNEKKFINSILKVMIANIISLLASIASGFVLPKLFSVQEYGYYKIFTLYLSYAGILHLGFVDGMLLKISGQKYEDLDKIKYKKITLFYIIFQGIVCFLIWNFVFFISNEYRYMIFFLGLGIFSMNVITYFQFISQATMKFSEFSVVKVVTAGLTFISICVLYIFNAKYNYDISSKCYIAISVTINWLILVFYLYRYKDITVGKIVLSVHIKQEIVEYFKNGFLLTISYQILQLILNLDRQFVSILFSTEDYAVYSFAYSLISMITTVISAVSLVLFPTLKQTEKKEAIKLLPKSLIGVEWLVLLCFGGYFPLARIIKLFLPQYSYSINYLAILFPGLVFSSCITLVLFNYYKLFDYNRQFFAISIIVLAISLLFNIAAWKIFDSPNAISYASVITMAIWYVITISYLNQKNKILWKKNFSYMIICVSIFYSVIFNVKNIIVGFFVYEIAFLAISVLFNKKEIGVIFNKLKKFRV